MGCFAVRRLLIYLLLVCAMCSFTVPPLPVSVVIRILSGPWESTEYGIAHGTLTVLRHPAVRAADRTPRLLFRAQLPPDAAYQRLAALDPATYHGAANELLDGGGVLVVDLLKGSAKQSVRYQSGTYAEMDKTTAFLLTYLNQHVPAGLAISSHWITPAQPSQPKNGRFERR